MGEVELPVGYRGGRGRDTVVALHGFTGTGADFEVLVEVLGGAITLVAPDLPGHGLAADAVLDLPTCADALARLVDREGLDRPWLLGYSMGGRTALQLAVRHPDRIRGLVLVGAHPGITDADERAARLGADARRIGAIERAGVDAFLSEWRRIPLIATQDEIPQPWLGRMRERRAGLRGAGLQASLEGMGTGGMEPLWHALTDLPMPVLWLAGERDPRYVTLTERAARATPRGTHAVVPGAGHAAHLEAPQAFADIVRRWLAAVR